MPKFKRKSINLLEPVGSPSDTWSSLYNWVLKIGRYILLTIEIIVLVVFFSRFVLDKVNNDLTGSINDKVAILSNKNFRSDEQKYRNILKLFSDINYLSAKQPLNSATVATVLSGIPSDLTLSSFSFSGSRVSISIVGSSLNIIRDYEFSLRQNPSYNNVIFIINKSNGGKEEYVVTITFNITSTDTKNGTVKGS